MQRFRGSGDADVAVLGHRRLSIIDLSDGGHQPMVTTDRRHVVVFNGEIYNYRQLRRQCMDDGIQFRSDSDTEVVLSGVAKYGVAFVERLRGMFAFAVYDVQRGRAILARDPFGIKPLYVTQARETVFFASELRALLTAGVIGRKLCTAAVESYLEWGSVAEPLTMIAGVEMLPAGCWAEVTLAGGRATLHPPVRFATLPVGPQGGCLTDAREAAGTVRSALRDSVAHHLVSDVPVGIFLSGGIDSSAVAALASEVSAARLDSFTVTFAENEFSEAAEARLLSRRFGTRHHEIALSGSGLRDMLPAAFRSMDQPSMDGINTFAVSGAVRQHGIKVVLSGLGGDELFAGYPSFRRAATLSHLWKVPRMARRLAAGGARAGSSLRSEKARIVLDARSPASAAYRASRSLFGQRQRAALLGVAVRDGPLASPRKDLSLLQQVTWYELAGYMRNTLLRDSDVFSMAHGLELRVPFVDREVVHAAARVADALKLRRGRSKPTLISALSHLLPRDIWDRPKRTFTLPFDQWMRGPLRSDVERVLHSAAVENSGLVPSAVAAVWRDFVNKERGITWSRPWALYTLVRWANDHLR